MTWRKNMGYVTSNKFKQVAFYKSVQAHTSENTFVGIANGLIKRRSKVHQKNISREQCEYFQ